MNMKYDRKIWEEILQHVQREFIDLLTEERIKSHIEKLAMKFQALKYVRFKDSQISLSEEIPEGDEGLQAVCVVLGIFYNILEMFYGPTKAKESIRKITKETISQILLSGEKLGFDAYLPDLAIESDVEDEEIDKVEKDDGEEYSMILDEKVQWGRSISVISSDDSRYIIGAEFVKDGLKNNEYIIAILASPVDKFMDSIKERGVRDEDFASGKIRVIDWYTFKMRKVMDLEEDGYVLVLPKELPHVSGAVNLVMEDLPEGSRVRFYVDLVSQALKFVDFETVYNFVQITKLKIMKKSLLGMFLMEPEHEPEKISILQLYDGIIEVKKENSTLTAHFTGKIFGDKIKKITHGDVLTPVCVEEIESDEKIYDIEKELGLIEVWKKNYNVEPLIDAIHESPEKLKVLCEEFQKKLDRVKEIESHLKLIGSEGIEDKIAIIKELMKNPYELDKIEMMYVEIKNAIDEMKKIKFEERFREEEIERVLIEEFEDFEKKYDISEYNDEFRAGDISTKEKILEDIREKVAKAKILEKDLESLGLKEEYKDKFRNLKKIDELEDFIIKEKVRREREIIEENIRKIVEYREKIENWEGMGYNISELKDLLSSEKIKILDEKMKEYEKKILSCERVKSTMEEMKIDDYTKGKIMKEIASLNDEKAWNMIDIAKRKIDMELEMNRRMIEEYKKYLKSLEDEGFNVSHFFRMMDEDIEEFKREILLLKVKVKKIREIRDSVSKIDDEEFKEYVDKIMESSANLEDMEYIEEMYKSLMKKIREKGKIKKEKMKSEHEERKKLVGKLLAYLGENYEIKMIREMIYVDIETLRKYVEKIEKEINLLKEIKDKIKSLREEGISIDISEAELRDPMKAVDIYRRVQKIEKSFKHRENYLREIEKISNLNYDTSRLRKLLQEDFEEFLLEFEKYKRLVEKMEDIKKDVSQYMSKYPEECAKILEMMKHPDINYDEILNEINDIKEMETHIKDAEDIKEEDIFAEMPEEEEIRKYLIDYMEKMMDKGYSVYRLEEYIDAEPNIIKKVIAKFENDVKRLKELEKELEYLEGYGFDDDLNYLRKKIKDVDAIQYIESQILAMKKKIEKIKRMEEKKKKIIEEIKRLEAEGIDVSHLKKIAEESPESLIKEYTRFKLELPYTRTSHVSTDDLEKLWNDIKSKVLSDNDAKKGKKKVKKRRRKVKK